MRLVLLGCLAALAGCGVRLPGKPVEPPKLSPPEAFERLVAQNCAGCHGNNGKDGSAPPLNDRVFLAIVPDAVLAKVIREGRPGTLMPAFAKDRGGALLPEEVALLAGGMKKYWRSAKSAEGMPPYLSSEAGDAAAGARVFVRACAGCHGEDGRGEKEASGEVRRRIHDEDLLALLSDQALRRLVLTGRPDLGMPDYAEGKGREKGYKPLSGREVTDLVALLVSWRQSGAGDK